MSQNQSLFLKQIKEKLALLIVQEEFGQDSMEIMQTIFKCQPYATLDKIVEHQKSQNQLIKAERIQEYLLFFIKNDIIYTQKQKYHEDDPDHLDINLYYPNLTSIYQFLRLIQYINQAKNIFGQQAGFIIEYFTNNQSGNVDQCIQSVIEENPKLNQQDLRKTFIQLVYNQYLTRNLVNVDIEKQKNEEIDIEEKQFQEIQEKKEEAPQKKSKKSKNKQNLNNEENQNLKKVKLDNDSNKDYKNEIEQQFKEFLKQNNQQDNPDFQNFLNSEIFGQFNKNDKQKNEQSAEFLLKDVNTNTYFNFQINHQRFIHDFRTKEICEIIEGKIGLTEKYIIQTMLEKTQNQGKSGVIKFTEGRKIDQIMEILPIELGKKKEHEIRESLETLNQDATKFILIEYEGSQKIYKVNVKKIVNSMRFRHIAKIIERKYDIQTARVFRILKQYKCLDEVGVSDLGLLSIEQARTCLQTLVKDGFIQYDNAKEKDKINLTLQAYSYNKADITHKIQEFYFSAIYNIKIKLSKAYQKSKEIEDSLDQQQRTQEWQQIVKMIKSLEIALLELDSALLCFTEY